MNTRSQYRKVRNSKRRGIAERIARFVCDADLAQPFGGEAIKSGRKYVVLFCKPRDLDGCVELYGKDFVLVRYKTRYHIGLPYEDRLVFNSVDDALAFMQHAFVELDGMTARTIPRRKEKTS